MISAGEFRNGVTFELEGNVFQIVEFQHVKPGKGAAFVRTKLKNVITGGVVERTFQQKNVKKLTSTEEIMTIFTAMVTSSISCIQKHTSRCPSPTSSWVILSNS